MKKIVNPYYNLSIQRKLAISFIMGCLLILLIDGVVYYNVRQTLGQIDQVYISNIELNQLSQTLEKVQGSLYQYLETRSSGKLEEYYVYEQEYRELYGKLNIETVDSNIAMMEKNIYHMSDSYLSQTGDVVKAKRGRNVTLYKEGYEKSQRLYNYIYSSIDTLNSNIFLQNSDNYSVLRNNLNYMIIIAAGLLVAVMVTTIAWVIFITKSITKPLIDLAAAANEIALGNMEVGFPIVQTGDEITIVAKACNKMIDSIHKHIEETRENYEREMKHIENELIMKNDLKEAQLKYLQAQINPHFLFNALNAGAQLAMMEGAEKTCLFIENMADFFRYNVRKMDRDTTLREEIELVDNYIYILNVRFAGELGYNKQINDSTLDIRIPSMILQPLVENAVNHGIRNMDGDGVVFLKAYWEEGQVCIEVSDNGVGITKEAIEAIMKSQEQDPVEEKEVDLEQMGSGIGLRNVISRLNQYYGRDDVFSIENNGASPGTTVRLRI